MIITDEITPLKRLKNSPKNLHYRGNLELLRMKKVSIVGSRKVTIYTKNLIISLASALKKRGICVVSGGAIGCDIAAHIGAYPQTIAVFASGLDTIYPKSNEKIIRQIYENSLALSEYEDGVLPRGHQFLERNRIVVALSEALVIAQADIQSGSMQSARIAGELGIPIYVIPQRISESRGTNLLLRQNKAKIIDDIDIFADKFGQCDQDFADEFLNYIKQNPNLDGAIERFGDLVYEYELDGKIQISANEILVI